jgi:hypothetical protein
VLHVRHLDTRIVISRVPVLPVSDIQPHCSIVCLTKVQYVPRQTVARLLASGPGIVPIRPAVPIVHRILKLCVLVRSTGIYSFAPTGIEMHVYLLTTTG